MKESSRHHYIPQFYIKGFTDQSGVTYVYDKKSDKIWERQISSKGLFYEWDRNTVFKENDSSSIIEDYWYKTLDNQYSDVIACFRELENTESLLNTDNISKLQYFMIHLFWRLPMLDYAFDKLFEEAIKTDSDGNIVSFNQDYEKDGFKKLERLKLPNKIIKMVTNKNISGGINSKLFENSNSVYLLGDYPMLYRVEPSSFDDIINKEVFLPISANRLYSISNHSGLSFDFSKITTLNTLIINQSVRYVCSPDKVFLKTSVNYYKKQKQFFPLDYLREKIFN